MPKVFNANQSQKRRRPIKKILVLSGIGIVLLAGVTYGLHRAGVIDIPFLTDDTETTKDGINYGPPTEEENIETQAFKDGQSGQQKTNNPTPPPGQKNSVTPLITAWGQVPSGNVEVAGYVNGVIESGGTCTAKLEKSGQVATASQAATPNAQNVSCGFIAVERSKLSPGTWSVTLTYSSANSEGSSQSLQVEVQ